MIIPIGHDRAIRRYPWVTIGIIALCTLVQIWTVVAKPSEAELDRDIEQLTQEIDAAPDDQPLDDGMLDARVEAILNKMPTYRFGYHTGSGFSLGLLTSMFVHEGWLHLIGNMLFLWLAGSALEDRWGGARFAAFYLLGGVVATAAFEGTYHGEPIFLVGASGAVSAAMGAFLVNFAKTEITLWYFLMYRTGTFRMAAYIALPLWLGDQVLMAMYESTPDGMLSVAYAAHLGGFAFGVVAAILARIVFPRRATDDIGDDEEPSSFPTAIAREAKRERAPSASDAKRPDDRVKLCMDAIARRDLATVRTLASRAMIDLARAKDHDRVLELYHAVVGAKFKTVPLTDGAFVAAANAADARDQMAQFLMIAEAMRAEHPGSVQLPPVLWKLAELQRRAGREDDERATLQLLAERYPRHEHGARAAKELEKRRI